MSKSSPSRLPTAFQRLAWSNLAAQSAEQIALAAAALAAVLLLGAGEAGSGLLQAALTLPFLVVSIPAGVLADRVSRPRLMAGAEALRAAALVVVLVLLATGALTLPALAVLGFVGVCGTVVYSVATPALVPSLVGPERLITANARIELARTVALAGGPALGGALVGFVGPLAAFGVGALLSTAAVILLAGIREPARQPPPKRHPLQDIREGAVFVFGHTLLRPVFITQVIFNTASFVIQAVFVPYAVARLALSASEIGLTLAMTGAGMVIGALFAPRLMRRLPFGIVVALGPLSGLTGSAVIALTVLEPLRWLPALGFFFLGIGPILWVISTTTLRQAVTPPRLLGRASALNILSYGARPLGAAIGASVGGAFGAGTCLWLAVAGFALQAAVILLSPAVALIRQPEMTAAESGAKA